MCVLKIQYSRMIDKKNNRDCTFICRTLYALYFSFLFPPLFLQGCKTYIVRYCTLHTIILVQYTCCWKFNRPIASECKSMLQCVQSIFNLNIFSRTVFIISCGCLPPPSLPLFWSLTLFWGCFPGKNDEVDPQSYLMRGNQSHLWLAAVVIALNT